MTLARARDGKALIENLKEEKESLNASEDSSSFGCACSKVVQLITRFTGILRARVILETLRVKEDARPLVASRVPLGSCKRVLD